MRPRKIVQILNTPFTNTILALADDGSLWITRLNLGAQQRFFLESLNNPENRWELIEYELPATLIS